MERFLLFSCIIAADSRPTLAIVAARYDLGS